MAYRDIFNYDEKLILNNIGLYKSLKDCINLVLIQLSATQDDDVKGMYRWLHTKLITLSENEWEEMQKYMPFGTPYGFYDDEEEQEYIQTREWKESDVEDFKEMIADLEKHDDEKYGTAEG